MPESPQGDKKTPLWQYVLAGIPAVTFAALLAMAGTDADDATKHLKSYADKLDLSWPAWLTASQVLLVVGFVALVGIVYVFRGTLRTLPRRSMAASRAFRGLGPAVPRPNTQEVVAINDVRSTFRLAGAPAADRILSTCRDVQNDAVVKWVPFAWLLEQEKAVLRDTKNRLEGVLGDRAGVGLPNIRGALHEFLAAYVTVVRAVHEFERVGVDLLNNQYAYAYGDWERHHADLLARLNTIKEQPLLASIGPVVEKDLRSGDDLRYSSLYARATKMFQSASPDERAFLKLFCTEATPTPENPIDHSVYDAGLGLANDKLLKLEDGEDGARRFSLPVPVRQAWLFAGPSLPARERVDIHPSAVIHRMNPGGGVAS